MKLQRNALSVLEPPTGHEEDDEYEFDISSSGSDVNEFRKLIHFSIINQFMWEWDLFIKSTLSFVLLNFDWQQLQQSSAN